MTGREASTSAPSGAWQPFRHSTFTVLWIATLLSNIGTWMHDVGAGWLMTELSPSPVIVAAVQAATTLPVFLFALPAGALADIVDRRKLLIVLNAALGLVAALLALLVSLGAVTPTVLLLVTFAMGTGAAFMAPAWQAIVPQLVPREQLTAAVALNSMGINISRAIGPALAGFIIVAYGLTVPFALNALSVLGIIAALLWWRMPSSTPKVLPAETIVPAMISGLRFAFNSPPLKATLVRAAAFFLFASSFWSLLPLIARQVLDGGATLYGILLASLGVGAVSGAFLLPKVRSLLGADGMVKTATVGSSVVIILMAIVPSPLLAALCAVLFGVFWIAVVSTLNVSAQVALPNWVRARGLSIFLMVFFGSMTVGSIVRGTIATQFGIAATLVIAAIGALIAIPLTGRAQLNQGDGLDHTPSMHWPAPVVQREPSDHDGPAAIQVTYEIDVQDRERFLQLMARLAEARRRNGGYGWSLLEDIGSPTRYLECWWEASWLHHQRHHERISIADRQLQDEIAELHRGPTPPVVTHLASVI